MSTPVLVALSEVAPFALDRSAVLTDATHMNHRFTDRTDDAVAQRRPFEVVQSIG